jgi:hypothetical protein
MRTPASALSLSLGGIAPALRGGAMSMIVLLAVAGCGDDGDAEVFAPVGPGGHDGGARDAAAIAPRDAGQHDTEIFSGDLYLCGYDAADALVRTGNAAQPDLAIAADARGFALVHRDADGSLAITAVPITAPAQDPVRIVRASDAPAAIALAARAAGFLLSWRTGGDAGVELNVRELSASTNPVVTLTDALAPQTGVGELTALLGLPDGYVATWIEASGGEPALHAVAIGSSGEPTAAARTLALGADAAAALDLHLGALADGRAMLAWLERDADGAARVVGQTLGAGLAVEGEAAQLSKHAVADARFDLAGRGPSAGLIYPALDGDVREAIKFRRIDADGVATEAVLNIVNAPGRAVGGAIAAFGQGYAVAYRALPSLGVPAPVIRVAFIDQFGAIVHEAELGETTETGGPTALAATADGHLLVGWTSEWPSGPATHALKLDCPGALVLCGGPLER